jgi:pyridoxine kinase
MRAEMASIITISSHVAYGAVGNRIMVPALEALGISVTALSTVELPWHPGMNAAFGKGARIVPDDLAFAAMIDCFCNAPWLPEIDGLITGYLGSPAQAAAIAKLVKALKQANPAALYLCDPVVGDINGLYVPEATANAIRDQLWPLADIVTPNLFEFGWMTGMPAADIIAKTDKTGNLLVTEDHSSLISHDTQPSAPNGTGDMLAALFLGYIVQGNTAAEALGKTASSVLSAINHANEHDKSSLSPEHLHDVMSGDLHGILVETLP